MADELNKTERYEDAVNTLRGYKEDREAKALQLANLKAGKSMLKQALFSQIRGKLAERNSERSASQGLSLMDDINDIIKSSMLQSGEDQNSEYVSPMMQLSNFREKLDSLPEEERSKYEEQLANEFYDEMARKNPGKYPNLKFANNLSDLRQSDLNNPDGRMAQSMDPHLASGNTLDYSSMLDMNFRKANDGNDAYFGLEDVKELDENGNPVASQANLMRSFMFKVHKFVIFNIEAKL